MQELQDVLKADDVARFTTMVEKDDITLQPSKQVPSILRHGANLVAYVAYYGAVKCFMYLMRQSYSPTSCDSRNVCL